MFSLTLNAEFSDSFAVFSAETCLHLVFHHVLLKIKR